MRAIGFSSIAAVIISLQAPRVKKKGGGLGESMPPAPRWWGNREHRFFGDFLMIFFRFFGGLQ
jgi:hypothetical protein